MKSQLLFRPVVISVVDLTLGTSAETFDCVEKGWTVKLLSIVM